MDNFVPDIYQKSIYTINYEKLKKAGIKCIAFDLDNTMVPLNVEEPNMKLKVLIAKLKDMNFKVIIMSNNSKKRLKPFKEILEIDCSAKSKKPWAYKFCKIMKDLDYKEHEMAFVGDQLITDIYGANKVGWTTILVNPIGNKDHLSTTLFGRKVEKIIMRSLKKKQLFLKGKYHD